jgi:virulence-associated protein VapD
MGILKNFKAINFDLNTNAIKACIANGEATFTTYNSAYSKIERFLKKADFAHVQGSGYNSTVPMDTNAVVLIFKKLGTEYPWLAKCTKACQLTSFDKGKVDVTDLTPYIQSGAEQAQSSTEIKRHTHKVYSWHDDKSYGAKLREEKRAKVNSGVPQFVPPPVSQPVPQASPTKSKAISKPLVKDRGSFSK